MTNNDDSAWYIPGGNNKNDKPVDPGVVREMVHNFGKTPEQMQGPNIGVARLAGTIIGAINHMEQPDNYKKNDLEPELINRRYQLQGLVNNINTEIQHQEQLKQRQISKEDMDELNSLLNSPSSSTNKKPVNNVTYHQSSFINQPVDSLSNRYNEERNQVLQSTLPLFDGTSGLTIADRTFIREEFEEVKKVLKQIEEKYNHLISLLATPNLPVNENDFNKDKPISEPPIDDEEFLTFDSEDDTKD